MPADPARNYPLLLRESTRRPPLYAMPSMESRRHGGDAQGLGLSHVFGGQRDPLNQWDFGDMWVPSLPAAGSRDGAITINDVIAILPWIGALNDGAPNVNGNDYDSDTNGTGVEDGADYDRSASTTPGKPWRLGAPDGAVSINDAIAVLNSIGDHC